MKSPEQESEAIFLEENFLSFLREEIYRRKEKRSSLNFSQLAKKIGISTSLLSLILSGKRRVSLTTAEALSQGFGFRGRKRNYFLTLARLHNARTEEEKWNIQNELMKIRQQSDEKISSESLLELRQYRLISDWYYSVIYVLCGLKNVEHHPGSFQARLGPEVSLEEIGRALLDLEALGLIKKVEERYVQTMNAVSTGSDKKDAAIYKYHRDMLRRAEASLKLPSHRREIAGLSIAIPREKISVVKSKIRDFISDLNVYLSQFDEADGVYQFNTQLFELTQSPEDKIK